MDRRARAPVRPSLCAFIGATSLVVACGGSTLDAGSTGALPRPDGAVTEPATTYSSEAAASALGHCSEPHGALDPYSSVANLMTNLVGAGSVVRPRRGRKTTMRADNALPADWLVPVFLGV